MGVCVRFGGVLAVLGAMIAVTLNPSGALAEREIRFGSVAMDIPAEMYRRLAPSRNTSATSWDSLSSSSSRPT